MPSLPYYNGQMVTPPEYSVAPIHNHTHQHQAPVQNTAQGYSLPPPYHAINNNQQPQQQQVPVSRSQMFDNSNSAAAYSQNGTTFYLPPSAVPLDQMSHHAQPQHSMMPPPPPHLLHPMPPPPPHLAMPPPLPSHHPHNSYQPPPPPHMMMPPPAPAAPVAPATTKVTGGVSATLDYSIEEMGRFLSTMSCGIMLPSESLPASSFQTYNKFVTQLLTATRLPSATVILSLVYLSRRWALGNLPSTTTDNNVIYRMLVVSLLLANKFHDDNTFTNKSWYEATGIAVSELTRIEMDWLREIKWDLHLNDQDQKGWDRWNDCWLVFSKKKTESTEHNMVSPVSPTSPVVESDYSGSVSPNRPGYTIPRWYEMANNNSHNPATAHNRGGGNGAANGFSSFFQQSFANDTHKDHRGSYYVSAYNNMATCNCSMCVFEPATTTTTTMSDRPRYPPQQTCYGGMPNRLHVPSWGNALPSMNWYPSVAAC
ncbi:hypothetical protein TRICI_006042 [Trichomonascus ciferrii]|uniref:Cyclin-like domain-containing protein n=1 Tax=Trichomonascus ciferrii TaxID=44093 RepID=A0A642UMG7_9ASCO|nr:hypothetical protein TRICI_006042 [Trichomonascus ciferrii]